MLNKFNKFSMFFVLIGLALPCMAADVDTDAAAEQYSADAVAAYDPDGSLFQQITDLEQEKVLMQLEKERAQLDLDLDRLAAEKIKLHMEIDTLSGRAEQQQQELAAATAKLEAETAKLERERAQLESDAANVATAPAATSGTRAVAQSDAAVDFAKNYKLVNVIGVGNQLQATLTDLNTGQNRRVTVGRMLDGYTVRTISMDEGVVLVGPDGDKQVLNVTAGK